MTNEQRLHPEGAEGTDLCSDFEHILEGHTGVGELALEHHDNVFVVLFNLLSLCRG